MSALDSDLERTAERRELIYIAAPYTAKQPNGEEDRVIVNERVRIISLCIEQLILKGVFVVSPMLMHLVRSYANNLPGDWAYWGDYSKTVLSKCDAIFVLTLDGWDRSTGVREEIDFSASLGLPISYISPDRLLKGW